MEQTIQLTQSLPTYADETSKWLNELAQREEFKNFNLEEQLASANLSLSNLFNIILVSLSASDLKNHFIYDAIFYFVIYRSIYFAIYVQGWAQIY